MKDENGLTLILGGVRSGKSQYGEHMALDWHAKDAKNRELHYIATARNLDPSMNQRILQHQNAREARHERAGDEAAGAGHEAEREHGPTIASRRPRRHAGGGG